jgi:hypothetical protein
MAEEWKKSFLGAAARAEVDAYFNKCLRLVDSCRMDEAEHLLSRCRWRFAVDLTGVPKSVVDSTDGLCSDAVGLIEYGNVDAIGRIVRSILALWQVAAALPAAFPTTPDLETHATA